MIIAAYHGTSAMSFGIKCYEKMRWFPGQVSHVSMIDDDMGWTETEAWDKGVTKGAFGANHTPGTIVDLYRIDLTASQKVKVREFLNRHVGDKYDYWGIVHFITHRPESHEDQDKWFCSELIFAALLYAGVIVLARVKAYKVFPEYLLNGPALVYWKTIKVGDKLAA